MHGFAACVFVCAEKLWLDSNFPVYIVVVTIWALASEINGLDSMNEFYAC